MIQTAVVGGYPKTLHNQLLRKTLHAVDQDPFKKAELEKVLRNLTNEVIEEQLALGMDWVSDGGLRWQDEVTYFAGSLSGVELNGLLRYFDTNVYFRQPVVKKKPTLGAAFLSHHYHFAHSFAEDRLQLVVVGPFTLALLSCNETRLSLEQLAQAYTEALVEELYRLKPLSARVVLLEPGFLKMPQKSALFKKLIKQISALGFLETIVYVYFGNVRPAWKTLCELEASGVGFDFTYTPHAEKLVTKRWDKEKIFYAGILDARNTKLETKKEIHFILKTLCKKMSEGRLLVTPSANLEYLPLDRCRLKLKNMVSLVQQFNVSE